MKKSLMFAIVILTYPIIHGSKEVTLQKKTKKEA